MFKFSRELGVNKSEINNPLCSVKSAEHGDKSLREGRVTWEALGVALSEEAEPQVVVAFYIGRQHGNSRKIDENGHLEPL